MRGRGWLVPALVLGLSGSVAMAEIKREILTYDDLIGWEADDHAAGLAVFAETCGDMEGAEWDALCRIARTGPPARDFFETFFLPVRVYDEAPTLFTGYFEPELSGSLEPDARFRFPLYAVPPDLPEDGPWLTRREIEEGAALAGRGLEIAWVDDPVALYFLHVQGSGRVRLPDGSLLRVGYGAANRQPYSSIGAELVARGLFEPHQVSADVIANWVRKHPEDGRELLWTNDSFVFFREVNEVPPDRGPLGAMNRSITALRSIAVDPAYVALGTPMWVEKDGSGGFQRLMVAQDTGSAIKGPQRADIFYGTGAAAGRAAGRVRDGGRLIQLLPIQQAYALVEGDAR